MKRPNKFSYLLILAITFLLYVSFATPVFAIVPQVTDIVVWNSGGDTILNVTVYHTPVTTFHYVDQIDVNVDGNITSFPVEQPSETFTTPINLGQITGTPSATVRARCTVDGRSSWSEPLLIPEFPSFLILPLSIIATLLAVVYVKKRKKH